MIGFQFIFPYSLNIIMALITATAGFELVSAVGLRKISHVSIAKCRVCACNSANTQSNVLVHGYIFPVYHFHAGFYHISLQKVKFQDICVVYGMTLLVTTALNTVSLMRYLNPQHCMLYVVMALFAAWIADAGAYFLWEAL